MTAVWPSQVHILAFVCSHRLLLATQECARWRVLGCGRFFIREEGVGFTGLKKRSPHPLSQLLPWVMSEKKRGMACYSSLLLNDGCWTRNDGWWRVRGLWVGIEQGLACGKYHDWKKLNSAMQCLSLDSQKQSSLFKRQTACVLKALGWDYYMNIYK